MDGGSFPRQAKDRDDSYGNYFLKIMKQAVCGFVELKRREHQIFLFSGENGIEKIGKLGRSFRIFL